ncbi:MAG: M90 family metallopeptidase [bacterium]
MKLFPVSIMRMHILVSGIVAFSFFAMFNSYWGTGKTSGAALIAGIAFFMFFSSKYIRRIYRDRREFPDEWRHILDSRVDFYRKLSESDKRLFERDIRIFMDEQRIYALKGRDVADEIKLLIAASAAILGFGLPEWEWPDLRDILVYPSGFNEEYSLKEDYPIRGMVHRQGPIIFSEKDLKMGFLTSGTGYHVGLHEMAHVLDMANGEADGVPVGMDWMVTAPWVKVMADRIQKVRRGECQKILRDYAGVDEAEFFAVAVEVFFQRPAELAAQDPELYKLLQSYFRIDPEKPVSGEG